MRSPKGAHANSVGLRRSLRGLVRSLAPLRGLRLSAFGSEVSTLRRENAAECGASPFAVEGW